MHEVVFLNIEVKMLDKIEVVKWKIHKILSIPPMMQTLRYMEDILESNNTVKFYKITEDSTIMLISQSKYLHTSS